MLWTLLDAHPGVRTATLRPEPKWFLRDDVDQADHAAYDADLFGGPAPTPEVRVEKSTTYLERPAVARRMAGCLPGVHVVAVLRDPVERAISNYWFTRRHGLEDRPLADAMTDEGEARDTPAGLSTSPFHYRRRGEYARLLGPWQDVFGSRLHLLRHRDVVRPGTELDALVAAVGLAPTTWPAAPRVVNAGDRGRDPDEAGVRASLARHFVDHTAALATGFAVDVSGWATADDDQDQPGRDLGGDEPD